MTPTVCIQPVQYGKFWRYVVYVPYPSDTIIGLLLLLIFNLTEHFPDSMIDRESAFSIQQKIRKEWDYRWQTDRKNRSESYRKP